MLAAILPWRKRRPQDFKMANYLPSVFISLMYALVFFTSYLIVRATQPTNYRAEFGSIGNRFCPIGYLLWIDWQEKPLR
jgi:hypothetical protein